MRVLILTAAEAKINELAVSLQKALQREGAQTDLVSADAGDGPVSTALYSLVCVVSGFKGWWKPKIPSEIEGLLKRTTRLEGKRGGAFVEAKVGSTKALRALMADLERQGVMVADFGTLGGEEEIAAVAKRLKRLG
ncbi:MAG: hypothetical protein GX335_10670 [Firmicutes bacterium]|nr:hypothetical protein [Bacillota bacterium]